MEVAFANSSSGALGNLMVLMQSSRSYCNCAILTAGVVANKGLQCSIILVMYIGGTIPAVESSRLFRHG